MQFVLQLIVDDGRTVVKAFSKYADAKRLLDQTYSDVSGGRRLRGSNGFIEEARLFRCDTDDVRVAVEQVASGQAELMDDPHARRIAREAEASAFLDDLLADLLSHD